MLKNKRAVLGEIIITFIATVIIVFILVVFALVSGVIKTVNKDYTGTVVKDASELGAGNLEAYMADFYSLANLRISLEGKSVSEREKMIYDFWKTLRRTG